MDVQQDRGPGAAGARRVGEAAASAVGRVRQLAFLEWDAAVSDVCRRLARQGDGNRLDTRKKCVGLVARLTGGCGRKRGVEVGWRSA